MSSFVTSKIPTDITVQINNITFHFHKVPKTQQNPNIQLFREFLLIYDQCMKILKNKE